MVRKGWKQIVLPVTGNLTVNGNPSNLRLWEGSNLNDTKSVSVLCGLTGEFRVINAKIKARQFGSGAIAWPAGFTDISHVFIADDNSLYGIVDRTDTSGKKIIWAGDPVCKITDANGRLLFMDTEHSRPAVFDFLDKGTNDISSAFGVLRAAEPALYNADGTRYTGTTYQVKMLVEEYTANIPQLPVMTPTGRSF